MTQSLSHHAEKSQPTPEDEGTPLATLSRGAGLELRIRAKEFKGHRFVDIREWSRRSENDDFWPVKGRGIAIKIRELTEVIGALETALQLDPTVPTGGS